MICPCCSYENVPGVACCESCDQDLTAYDKPEGHSLLETSIMESPLGRFHPRAPVTVAPDATVAEAIAELCNHRIGCVIVGTRDAIEGIFSERDVLLRIADRYDEVSASPVREFMTPNPETLEIGTPIAFALNRMSTGDFRHLPVMRKGKLSGVISLRDVLHFLGEWYPDLIGAPAWE